MVILKESTQINLTLPNAIDGKVVVRFPPEASGYLHIGHSKAALINQYFAKRYNGKLIVRFDDTNPTKEKEEYEKSIIEDLHLLGIYGDKDLHVDPPTYASDYFDIIFEKAIELIEKGCAYVDNTSSEIMRKERFDGIASKSRDIPIEKSLEILKKMIKGEDNVQEYCLRAKISINSPNKSLRDPVIYRCQKTVPHDRTGFKYQAYPTYDLACPIVDSIEGVTHALRTSEYNDRNAQYKWILKKLDMRIPNIWDFSRLNFVYTLLSKRKLSYFVENNLVTGWDDPRMPTIRGILRRGLTLDALKIYILLQGASKNTLLLEWDKIWALNRKIIDPISPRYFYIKQDKIATLNIEIPSNNDFLSEVFTKEIPLHKKNNALGFKTVFFSNIVHLAHEDVITLVENEEITLMNWGNVIITNISDDKLTLIGKFNPNGDFKKTKKLTWIAKSDKLISTELIEYNFLINKKKLDENDQLSDCISHNTIRTIKVLSEPSIVNIKSGDIIQFERDGFYICDSNLPYKFIMIPDGKTRGVKPW